MNSQSPCYSGSSHLSQACMHVCTCPPSFPKRCCNYTRKHRSLSPFDRSPIKYSGPRARDPIKKRICSAMKKEASLSSPYSSLHHCDDDFLCRRESRSGTKPIIFAFFVFLESLYLCLRLLIGRQSIGSFHGRFSCLYAFSCAI